RAGFALAKSRRPLAAATGSPVTNAMAEGPTSCSSRPSTPASLAATWVSVFFTTAKVALPRSAVRSSLSCATVSPRYSVSTAAFDSRKRSAILATAAALSGLAMAILPVVVPPVASSAPERREPRAEAGLGNHGMARGLRLAPALAPLSGTSVPPAGQGGTTGGLWYAGHGTCSGPPATSPAAEPSGRRSDEARQGHGDLDLRPSRGERVGRRGTVRERIVHERHDFGPKLVAQQGERRDDRPSPEPQQDAREPERLTPGPLGDPPDLARREHDDRPGQALPLELVREERPVREAHPREHGVVDLVVTVRRKMHDSRLAQRLRGRATARLLARSHLSRGPARRDHAYLFLGVPQPRARERDDLPARAHPGRRVDHEPRGDRGREPAPGGQRAPRHGRKLPTRDDVQRTDPRDGREEQGVERAQTTAQGSLDDAREARAERAGEYLEVRPTPPQRPGHLGERREPLEPLARAVDDDAEHLAAMHDEVEHGRRALAHRAPDLARASSPLGCEPSTELPRTLARETPQLERPPGELVPLTERGDVRVRAERAVPFDHLAQLAQQRPQLGVLGRAHACGAREGRPSALDGLEHARRRARGECRTDVELGEANPVHRGRGDRLDRAELAAVLGEQALASTHLTTRSPRVPRELREAGPHEAPAHCERERRARAPPAHPSERGPGLVDLARRGVRLGGREPRVTHEALRPR